MSAEFFEVELSNGMVSIVDVGDYAVVAKDDWHAHNVKNTVYAYRHLERDGKQTTQYMHRLLLNENDRKRRVDHENRNGLDNRRSNIRSCSPSQNGANQGMRRQGQFKGVHFVNRPRLKKRFLASGHVLGKWKNLGYYASAPEAAEAYDRSALSQYGEFAFTNFPKEFYL